MPSFETGSSTAHEDLRFDRGIEEKETMTTTDGNSTATELVEPAAMAVTERVASNTTSNAAVDIEKSDVDNEAPPESPPFAPGYHPSDFPDGGTEAWLCVVGGALCLFCSFGFVNCAGIFVQYYLDGPLSSYSSSTVTWITSLLTFIITGSNAFTGLLFDRYGPRWMLPIGTVILSFGLMAISLSTKYYQFILSHGIVCGIGGAAVYNCAANSTLTWFFRHRAAALGIVVAGSSVGGIVLPIFLSKLIPRIGFPWAVRSLGFIFLGLCGGSCFIVKSRLPPQPKPFDVMGYVRPFYEARFSAVVAALFFVFWGMYLPFNYVDIQAQQQGVDPNLIPYLLAIINAVSVFGRILPGIIADKVGRFNTIIAIGFLSGIVTLGLWIPSVHSTGLLVAYLAIYGFTSGGFISLSSAVIAQISDLREIGTRSGVALLVGALGALTGPPLGGAIVTAQHGSYFGLQLFTGLAILVGALFLLLSRALQVGLKVIRI
ncbi:monocarboxylate permease-like protein [Xylariaceae sp. FL0255]|nr:monocarboxylate permease-like protein [Xylariaceae sp. FL0255]